jgi:hypothetical protein
VAVDENIVSWHINSASGWKLKEEPETVLDVVPLDGGLSKRSTAPF